ncbi:hypothetical protein EYC08_19145 [Tabrizicola sp. WMC-M-20]|nr:hypothetical protein EYC08_19145 [Tabrizicola sp. WMC-M-20]
MSGSKGAFRHRRAAQEPGLDLGIGPAVSPNVLDLFAGRRTAFTFNTRVAIRAAVDILGLRPGDEMLAPAYNCGSELDPLRAAGLTVRLYPIGMDAVVDPEQVRPLIGPRTRALYLTHYFGILQPHRAEFRALADAHGLRLIEDCALSLLSGTSPAEGTTGDVAVFCFYKFFAVLAGGALVVNAPDLPLPEFDRTAPPKIVVRSLAGAVLRRMLGQGGLDRLKQLRSGTVDSTGEDAGHDGVPDMPASYYFDPDLTGRRMAGITHRALARLDLVAAMRARRDNYHALLGLLAEVDGLVPVFETLPADAVPLSLPLRLRDPGPGAPWQRRDALVRALQAEGIAATPWWAGYNRHLDFSDHPDADLSSARHLKDTVLSLPIHQYFGPAQIAHVARRVKSLWQGQV